MNVFDDPPQGAPAAEVLARRAATLRALRAAPDPNEAGPDGRTLLTVALMNCVEGDGEDVVVDLLRRGADPNRPSAWTNFTTLLTVSASFPLVREFLDRGLRLDEVYEDVGPQTGGLLTGPATLLDYADAVGRFLAPRRSKPARAARKHAGGLGGRRRFIEETIHLLEDAGATRAADVGGNIRATGGAGSESSE